MKTFFILLSLVTFQLSANAQVTRYANPKTLNLMCEIASVYGNTNDSWSILIKGLDVAFWDNDDWSMGKYSGVTFDNTFGPSDRSYGNGRFFEYKGIYEDDKWSFMVGPTYLLEGNQLSTRVPFVYAWLKVPGKMPAQLFECKPVSLERVKEEWPTE